MTDTQPQLDRALPKPPHIQHTTLPYTLKELSNNSTAQFSDSSNKTGHNYLEELAIHTVSVQKQNIAILNKSNFTVTSNFTNEVYNV